MNKKFYFAALATAALFASCSSDDIAEAPSLTVNDSEQAPIEFLVGSPSGVTRGTGTVGALNTDVENNKWGGQQFNVYMLDKGTFDITEFGGAPIYKGTTFYAPNELGGVAQNTPAMEVTSYDNGGLEITSNVRYFPQDGEFDFWAYRLDDATAWDGSALTVDEATMTAQFKIDGSQDIMVAKAAPNVADNGDGTYGVKNVPADRIFSAYAVRRDVKPVFNFEHQLARLQFNIKASKELSDKSADPEAGVDAPNASAIKVTAIKVKAPNQGTLTIAYNENYTPNADTRYVAWETATEDLVLKQRATSYESQEDFESVTADKAYGTVNVNGGNVDYTAETEIYPDINDVDSKGHPKNGVAAGTVPDGNKGAYYIVRVTTPAVSGPISVSENLEALTAIAPIWNTTTDEAYPTPVGEALLVAPMTADEQYYELTIETEQLMTSETQTVFCTTEWTYGAVAETYKSTDASATVADEAAYDALDAAQKAGKGDAAALAAATVVANVGKYFYNTDDTKVYLIEVDAAGVSSNPQYFFANTTDAGAAETAYGAWVAAGEPTSGTEFDAKETAMAKGSATNGGSVTTITGTTPYPDTKTIKLYGPARTVGSTTSHGKYKAGKTYTITLNLSGLEPITGEDDNLGNPGYTVDEEGSEWEIDMDEAESL